MRITGSHRAELTAAGTAAAAGVGATKVVGVSVEAEAKAAETAAVVVKKP